MEPRTNPSLPPRFWELDPKKAFEPLCVDVISQEPEIKSADLYGTNGQGDKGVDIIAKNSLVS